MTAVAVAAGGARWEAAAIGEIEASGTLRLARRCVDAADLMSLAQTDLAQFAFVDPGLPGLDLDAVDRLERGGVTVVAVGESDRAGAIGIRLSTRLGGLEQVVSDTESAASDPASNLPPLVSRHGSIVAVWGPTGAPGRTTLAVALAAAYGSKGLRSVLVDADTYGGAVAQTLAILDEVSGLMAACRAANSGNGTSFNDHLLAADGFDVLTGIPRADMWIHVRPVALERILRALAQTYDVVVVDCGFGTERVAPGANRDQATLTVLEVADHVLAVGRADPVGVTRLVRALDATGPWDRQPTLILNRLRSSAGWDERSLGQVMLDLTGHLPGLFLPDEPATVERALLAGRTLRDVAPSSALVRRIDQLASSIVAVGAAV